MIFIFGGRSQGKLEYAKKTFGEHLIICDLNNCKFEDSLYADILINVHKSVKSMLAQNVNPSEYFKNNIDVFRGKIIIGNEIGSGIVPVDDFDRKWRDETGFVYQLLASKAEKVIRVWAGIGQILKGVEID